MKKEAISAGFYYCEMRNKNFPKIQILTINELLNGSEIEYFNIADYTFKDSEKHIDKLFN